MFEKVLLAVDGSEPARRAIPLAIDIAKKSGGEVIVFHAREHTVARGGDWDLEAAPDAQAAVDDVCRTIAGAGVEARPEVTRVLVGRVAQAIMTAADEHGADLVVMGSRGLSDLQGLLVGSVAHKVIHLSRRPVLVAR